MIPILAELRFPGWDPVAFALGPLHIRWYGLGYLAGFIVAGFVLDRLCRDGYLGLSKNAVSDLIGWLVVGVLVGGRLGYALFYDQRLLLEPVNLVSIWTGGLSFHGGLAGVVIASAVFARRNRVTWRRLADSLALAVPFGIFFVRCTNFVNAELYGRLAPAGLPWGVRFPTDPVVRAISPEMAAAGALDWHRAYDLLSGAGRWDAILAQIPLRHPSQLYEAMLEGLVTAAALWWAYGRRGGLARREGGIAALFLLLYGISRFAVEFFREPDERLGFVLASLSMGQLLSLAVLASAGVLYWWHRIPLGTFRASRPPDL